MDPGVVLILLAKVWIVLLVKLAMDLFGKDSCMLNSFRIRPLR